MSGLLTLLADAGSGPWGSPATVSLLGFTLLLYELGRRRLQAEAPHAIERRQVLAAWGGMAVLWVAICSPLDVAADQALWVHMIQHLLIGLVAPILWVHARPVRVFGALFDPNRRGRRSRQILAARRSLHLRRTDPLVGMAATVLHVAVWWTWHLPSMFDAALRNSMVHGLEHLCLFGAGIALWWVCSDIRWSDRGGMAILYLFLAAVGTGIVGAFLTIDPNPIYATTVAGAHRWGLTRITDQQLAGAIMWVVGGAIYLGYATLLAIRWLSLGPSRDRGAPSGHRPTLDDLLR